MNQLTTGRRKPSELVEEYNVKRDALGDALAAFEAASNVLKTAATIGGTWGNVNLDTGRGIYLSTLEKSLLQSAWRHVWEIYNLETIASAETKRRVEYLFENPPAFTIENIRDKFGDLVADPWGSVLRGLAEVFSSLDPAFKSHEKVKIGVKGLPKRVILSNVSGYGSWGRDRLRDILNALAAYQGKPLVEYREMGALLNGQGLLDSWTAPKDFHRPEVTFPARGVWLKRFANGNGHLYFTPETLLDVNRALAEFYGDVLPDAYTERKPATGTAVSKDLQYYPTPKDAVERLCGEYSLAGKRVLEPSCGCGRIMDYVRDHGGDVFGIEFHGGRVQEARAKGHNVLHANFLETVPTGDYDMVLMNPPFAGTHYNKHVRHALKFLKPGGILRSILPATSRHDHGLLDDLRPSWVDLPVGSFRESGVGVNTCIATIRA